MIKHRLKTEIVADSFDQASQIVVPQIKYPATPQADQVVMGLIGDDFELHTAPPQIRLAQDARIGQGLQGAIDRGQVGAAPMADHLLMDPLCAGMAVQSAESLKDDCSLRRQP